MANVLIVDDSSSMRQMISFTLTQASHKVTEAVDGAEGLKIAGSGSFELIISDINMPNMDGITLVTELRKLPSYKYTPILLLTTESATDKKKAGRAAGATGWLVKPFNPDQLIATANKVLA